MAMAAGFRVYILLVRFDYLSFRVSLSEAETCAAPMKKLMSSCQVEHLILFVH